MKKTIAILAAVLLLLSVSGCGRYVSSYKAVGFVRSNGRTSSHMSFFSLEGRMVFKMQSSREGDVQYSARLESGKATAWYDYNGIKSKLFEIGAGEELASRGGYIESGTVYIIVETDGPCTNGAFQFNIE